MSKETSRDFFPPDIWDDVKLDEVTERRRVKMAKGFAEKYTNKLNSGELDDEYGENAHSSFKIMAPRKDKKSSGLGGDIFEIMRKND